jgi:Tol biopolymer transport system component
VRDLGSFLELKQAWPLAFTRDGSALLIASDRPGVRQLFLVPSEGGEPEQLTDLPEPVDGTLLPDGRVLLSVDAGGNERTQLYLLEQGGEPEPLIVDPRFNHWTPVVSRDGAMLAYATNRGNGRDFEVVARNLGSGEERVFDLRGYLAIHGFSPDGRWIVAERLGELAGDSDLFLLEVETGDVRHINPHEGSAIRPACSLRRTRSRTCAPSPATTSRPASGASCSTLAGSWSVRSTSPASPCS